MAYQKIGFKNGDVLTAEQLIHMEDGIIDAEKKAASGGGTGTGLPSDVGAYKYMATDGEGNWVAEDRLAYDTRMTIKWDGNTEGRVAIATPEGDAFYKVSDYIPADGELKNAKYCVVGEDSPDTWEDVASMWEDAESAGMINEDFASVGDIIIVKKPNISLAGVVEAKETGIYFLNNDSLSFVSELQIGEVKKIPAEYLPSPTVFYAKTGNAYLYTDSAYGTKVTNSQLKDAIAANNVRIMYAGEYNSFMLFPIGYVYNESYGSDLSVIEPDNNQQQYFYTAEYVAEG